MPITTGSAPKALQGDTMAVSKMGRHYTPTPNFKPGGQKGKLHRELGVPEGEKIPAGKLRGATHSKSPEVRRDAIRAETMIHKFKHHGAASTRTIRRRTADGASWASRRTPPSEQRSGTD